jgi:hypothetical protein
LEAGRHIALPASDSVGLLRDAAPVFTTFSMHKLPVAARRFRCAEGGAAPLWVGEDGAAAGSVGIESHVDRRGNSLSPPRSATKRSSSIASRRRSVMSITFGPRFEMGML